MNARRRALGGLLALTWLAGNAAAQKLRTVGVLTQGSGYRWLARPMSELGWVEGTHVRYLFHKAGPDKASWQRGAAELLAAGVDALVGEGAVGTVELARATRTVPIVTAGISNPVGEGVADSLHRPGRNVTGLSFGLQEAAVLQVTALRSLLPGLKRLVVVMRADDGLARPAPEHESAAAAAGVATDVLLIPDMASLERAFARWRPTADAAWIATLPNGITAEAVAAIALKHRIATHSRGSDGVRAGMLMSYWTVHADPARRIAAILDKVLKGADPAAIPFELPDRTAFALNRATATALGLRIPQELMLRATEVIG